MKGILSLQHENGTLDVSDTALVVGIDDTGHDNFADKKHPVFGLGGCAVLAKDYFRYIDDPWRELKRIHFGGENEMLHASDLKSPTLEQLRALEMFFCKLPFFRFAAMAAETLNNETIETNIHIVSITVLNQIAEFSKLVQPTEIIFIIENSERIEKDLLKHFSAYRFGNNTIEIQPKVLLASKQVGASCVEVADFVMHPAGAQVRNRLRGFKKLDNIIRKDFSAVFHKVDSRLVRYQEILSAKPAISSR